MGAEKRGWVLGFRGGVPVQELDRRGGVVTLKNLQRRRDGEPRHCRGSHQQL